MPMITVPGVYAQHPEWSKWVKEIETIADTAYIPSAMELYLGQAPLEDVYSEHPLMVVRRFLGSRVHALDATKRERLIWEITEPQYIKERCGNPPSTRETVKYEIARFLMEIGRYRESHGLLHEILGKVAPHDPLHWRARDALALLLQSQGFFHRSCEIWNELLQGGGLDEAGWHFVLKHYATNRRRILLPQLIAERASGATNSRDEIIAHLQRAGILFDTYHIHFSMGYLYYLQGDCAKAEREYKACLDRLDDQFADEYYLIHIKLALLSMRQGVGFPQIRQRIDKFSSSLRQYGNFKRGLNQFLLDLINYMSSDQPIVLTKDSLAEWTTRLSRLLGSLENLYCIETDVETVCAYFIQQKKAGGRDDIVRSLEKMQKNFRQVFQAAREKFAAFTAMLPEQAMVLNREQGFCVCLDIRGFCRRLADKQTTDEAQKQLIELQYLVRSYLSDFCDLIVGTGDGYILTKIEANDGAVAVSELVTRIRFLYEEAMEKKVPLGVGITRGIVFVVESGLSVPFTGEAVNRAARMCDLARPGGIAISTTGLPREDVDELVSRHGFRRENRQGKHPGENYEVLLSHEAAGETLLSHPPVADDRMERRLFVHLGGKCGGKCLYCISHGVDLVPPEFFSQANLEAELDRHPLLRDMAVSGKEILFSFGHLSEVLDKDVMPRLVEAVATVLQHSPRYVVQIATKAGPEMLTEFRRELERKVAGADLMRVFLLYSLTSIVHAERLEGRKIPSPEELSATGWMVIPYVKPFLPGITDSDAELLEFLGHFPLVIVGYPYVSQAIMHKLAEFCLDAGLSAAQPHYNFAALAASAGNTFGGLVHPSHFRHETVALDCSAYLNAFTKKIRKPGRPIFLSSPCAVAFQRETDCYTAVGWRSGALQKTLCRGKKVAGQVECPNIHCSYHPPPSGKRKTRRSPA